MHHRSFSRCDGSTRAAEHEATKLFDIRRYQSQAITAIQLRKRYAWLIATKVAEYATCVASCITILTLPWNMLLFSFMLCIRVVIIFCSMLHDIYWSRSSKLWKVSVLLKINIKELLFFIVGLNLKSVSFKLTFFFWWYVL